MALVIQSHPKQDPDQDKSVVVAWHLVKNKSRRNHIFVFPEAHFPRSGAAAPPYLSGEPEQPGGVVAEGAALRVAESPGGDGEELLGHPAVILPRLADKHHLRAAGRAR